MSEQGKEIQRALNSAGFDLKVDGDIGPLTEAAMLQYLVQDRPEEGYNENDEILAKELERDEGRVLHGYLDSLGYMTLGIGRMIDRRKGGGISDEEADYLKRNDIRKVQAQLDANLPWWRELDPVRQRALQNMCFQLGISGLLKFRRSLTLLEYGQWEAAGENLRQSLWYKQTPTRAERVIRMFEKGAA